MFRSNRFDTDLIRLLRQHGNDIEALDFQKQADDLFSSHLRNLPAPFVGELFAHGLERIRNGEADLDLLGTFIDLLWQDYDDTSDPLSPGDWSVLRDLVDEHAVDLDMGLMHYIMERVVSHGKIDE